MKATQNAIAHPAEIGQWLKSLLEATWGNPWWDRKKSKCKYMSINEETQPIIWQSMRFDCFGMGLSLVPKKSYIYRTSMADDGSQTSPEWPRMANQNTPDWKHPRLRLVLVRKSPTVRTEGFDAFFCTRRSSWKLAQRFHSYCNLKISEETAGRWWLKAAPLFGFYTPTEKLCSGPMNPKALRMCPAFEFASISSSTRASSTRTWSGALICQTRYFFQKYENRTCINLQNHLLMILMSWFIGCFTSLRLDDAGPPSYGKSKNHGCINLYELTTMPQSGIWSLSWTKLAYKIYTLYKSLSIKNQLLTSLHTCYQPTIFSPSSSLTCARSMLLMVSALAIHHERQGLQHKSRSHQSQVVVFNCRFPYPSNDI